MAKRPLAWHKECLKNREAYVSRKQAELESAAARLRQDNLENAIYREQIRRAEEEGRDGFDAERFNKSRS